ncbi:MAG: D amino acid oxidase (DAO) family protein, partial [Burkholderiales bacterium 12-64-5]
MEIRVHDAVIIGGGFYGCAVAVYLAKQRGFKNILVVEREAVLFNRASYHNQARVHNGDHYPLSFTTAYRSRVNLPRFVAHYPQAIDRDFTKLYAIARRNSKVTANQFARFCKEIGANIEPATDMQRQWFEPKLIEAVFQVEEYAFNASILARMAEDELRAHHIVTRFNTRVTTLTEGDGVMYLDLTEGDETQRISAHYVFNCTYSGLN